MIDDVSVSTPFVPSFAPKSVYCEAFYDFNRLPDGSASICRRGDARRDALASTITSHNRCATCAPTGARVRPVQINFPRQWWGRPIQIAFREKISDLILSETQLSSNSVARDHLSLTVFIDRRTKQGTASHEREFLISFIYANASYKQWREWITHDRE